MPNPGTEPRIASQPFGAWIDVTPDAMPRWFVFHTRPRAEKQIERQMTIRGIEGFLPLLRCERRWHDRKKIVGMPLFPGYVFARVSTREISRVCTIAGVIDAIRVEGRPVPATDAEIRNVRRLTAALDGTQVQPTLTPLVNGLRIRVVDGPFHGIEGVVLDARGQTRVLVSLEVLGQGVEVNIGANRVEPVS